jgi:ribonuclease HI
LWKALDQSLRQHDVRWHWVKAHAGNDYNNRVDRLAREAMKRGS